MLSEPFVLALAEAGQVWPDGPTIRHLLGRPWTSEERTGWFRLLRRSYGVEALRAAWSVLGRDALLVDLHKLQPLAADWLRRISEGPTLAPLLAAHLKVAGAPPPDFKVIKDGLTRRGLTPATWKWLCRQHRRTVRTLCALGWSQEAIFWCNVLARAKPTTQLHPGWLEAGRPYLLANHYHSVAAQTPDGADAETLQLERLLRLVPAVPDEKSLREYEGIAAARMAGLYDPQWELRFEPGNTWKSLLERLRRLNDARLKLAEKVELNPEDNLTWEPVLGTLNVGGVQARELTSVEDLMKEGLIQSHCVGNGAYTSGCLDGTHIVMGLEDAATGLRATLQLVNHGHAGSQWVVGQLAGIGNSHVPQFFWKVTRDIQQRLAA